MHLSTARSLAAVLVLGSTGLLRAQQFEAEDYNAMYGIVTEPTTDTGLGLDVAWVDPYDFMDYNVTVPATDYYRLDFRIATTAPGMNIQLAFGPDVAASVDLPNTGGWQNWQTVSTIVHLNAGPQTFRIRSTTGGWNLNWFKLTGGIDVAAPSTVTNLTAGAVTSASVVLNWSAPSDNGQTGHAASYSIRYSPSPITAANFASATVVANPSLPAAAGSPQTLTVNGLASGVTYYFALTSTDGSGNTSVLSNVASKATAPDLIAPSAITSLSTGTASSSSVVSNWIASGDDGQIGTATTYSIRYSKLPISAANFSTATAVVGAPLPAIAGSHQTVTVNGLDPQTIYYFAMTVSDETPNSSTLSNIVSKATVVKPAGARIAINSDMVTNELGIRDDRGSWLNLFDEQSDITTGAPTRTPVTDWRVGGDPSWYPAGLVIDLGQEYDISNVYWYDGAPMVNNGVDIEVKGGKVGVEGGTPFNWTPQFIETMANDAAWHHHTTNFRSRYIHINKYSTATYRWQTYGPFTADAPLLELVVYGTPVGNPPAPPVARHTPLNLPMNELIGGVSWWYGDPATFTAVGIVRAYHDFVRSSSTSLTGTLDLQDYDAFYSQSNDQVLIYPCLQGNAEGSVSKPTYGGDSLQPATYALHADNLWQWTARYGRNTNISTSLIRLPSWQTPYVGLGYLKYIENWNEPDNYWSGSANFFHPYEFAAMSSADYDGDLGKLGPTFGVKNADPTMKFAMGGLASYTPDYVKAMKLWSDHYRAGVFPSDVLNFHHYDQNADKTQGASPETDNLLGLLQDLVRYRDYNLPGKEVWLSEFGWDVEGGSTQQAMTHTQWPNNGYDSEELQASWITRAYLIGAKAGIDRMMNYTIGDSGGGWGTYATCGLLDFNGVKRKSWYYVSTMKQTLSGMIYIGEQATGNPNVYIYKFKNLQGSGGAYAIWCPTSNGTTLSGYKLNLDGFPTSATLVTMVKGNPSGVLTALTIQAHAVTVDVSEQPIFVKVDTITAGASPDAAYNQWTTQYVFPVGYSAQTSDPDGDGYANLLEFVLAQDPLHSEPSKIFVIKVSANGQDYPALSYIQRHDIGGVQTSVRASTALSFNNDLGSTEFSRTTRPDGDFNVIVRSNIPLSTSPRQYLRLDAILP